MRLVEVPTHNSAVLIVGESAHEGGLSAESGETHGDIERAASGQHLGATIPLDNVNERFSNDHNVERREALEVRTNRGASAGHQCFIPRCYIYQTVVGVEFGAVN
ncbi:hypothetical protein GCM10022381_38540 [Leifsonia kafniensis]|uniref:Uncharacterized protein n=1 Tax=Leifsonia kafniensis TaxID=475957 RepID=A0ABP7L3B2_9MICO